MANPIQKTINTIARPFKRYFDQNSKINELQKQVLETMHDNKIEKSATSTVQIMTDNTYTLTPSMDNKELIEKIMKDPAARSSVNATVDSIFAGKILLIPDPENEITGKMEIKDFKIFMKTAGGGLVDIDTGLRREQVNFNGVARKAFFDLIYYDDFYVYIRNNSLGIPAELMVLDPTEMKIHTDSRGRLRPLVIDSMTRELEGGAYTQEREGKIIGRFAADEIIHKNYYSLNSQKYGNSLMLAIKEAVETKEYSTKYSKGIYQNQRPKGMWLIRGINELFKATRESIINSKKKPEEDLFIQIAPGQSKEGEKTVEFVELSAHKDMPYTESRRIEREEISSGTRVPLGVIGIGTKETSGWDSQTQLQVYDIYIEGLQQFGDDWINEMLLPRFGYSGFRVEIERKNTREKERNVKIAQGLIGLMTPNEIRKNILGIEPLDDPTADQLQKPQPNFGNPNQGNGADNKTELSFKNKVEKAGKPTMLKEQLELQKVNELKLKQDLRIRESIRKEFTKEMLNGLTSFFDNVETEIFNSNINKALDPNKKFDAIDDIKTRQISLSITIGQGLAIKSFDAGAELASKDMGIMLIKAAEDNEALNFLESMNIELIEGVYSEASKSVKTALRLGIARGESVQQIVARLRKGSNSVEQIYKRRFENIVRTETARAYSEGRINAYDKSGLQNVQALVGLGPDNKGICESLLGGSPGELGRIFTIEESRGLIPSHPSCTCCWVPVTEYS